jgi:hypothetical protein
MSHRQRPQGLRLRIDYEATFLLPFLAARPIGLRASGPRKRAAKTWPGTGPPSRQSRAGLEDANPFFGGMFRQSHGWAEFSRSSRAQLPIRNEIPTQKAPWASPASLSAAHSFKRPWIFEINAPDSCEIFGDGTRRSAAELEDV